MKISVKTIGQFFKDLKTSFVNFFTDGKINAGPVIAKSQLIEIIFSTSLFLIPLPMHGAVAVPARIAVAKMLTLYLDTYTFMKWPRGHNNATRALLIAIGFTALMAIMVYVLALEFPVVIVGALLNIILTFTC